MYKKITTPITDKDIENLKAGDKVLISGTIYTARDAAHKRMIKTLSQGDSIPIDVSGQLIYYMGPCPAKPGHVIGSAGPTSSYRQDAYTPSLLDLGLKAMLGKGNRSQDVIDSIKKNKAVYLVAVGGAAALIAKAIKKVEVVAYDDLGTEAIRKLEVEDLSVIVAIDSYGNNLYVSEREKFRVE